MDVSLEALKVTGALRVLPERVTLNGMTCAKIQGSRYWHDSRGNLIKITRDG